MNKKTSVIKNYALSPNVLYLDYTSSVEEGVQIDTLITKLTLLTGKLRILGAMKQMEAAFKAEKYSLSKKYAAKILEVYPDNVNALRGMGLSLFMLKDYEVALKYLLKSLELSEDKEFDYTYIGWCYCNLNNHLKACQAFDCAVEINPLYEPALTGRTQAIIHLHGDRLETVESLEKRRN